MSQERPQGRVSSDRVRMFAGTAAVCASVYMRARLCMGEAALCVYFVCMFVATAALCIQSMKDGKDSWQYNSKDCWQYRKDCWQYSTKSKVDIARKPSHVFPLNLGTSFAVHPR